MPSKSQSILLVGVVAGVLISLVSLVPIVGGCVACLAYIGAGMGAVWHYTNTHQLTIAGGSGAGLGALTGIIAVLVGSLISYILMTMGLAPDVGETLRQFTDSGAFDEEQLEIIESLTDSPALYIGAVAASTVLGAILGTIGGAIGASMFKNGGDQPA